MTTSIHDFKAARLNGNIESLAEYRGRVLLIVNTASECGFTPQYAGLEALHQQFKDRGLAVLGFPCNQFGGQEPGDAEAIGHFCQANYGVTFPMFAKVDVNGGHADPLFAFLKHQAPGALGTEAIKWNFTKFLVSRDGGSIRRYAPATEPASMAEDIEAML